MDSPVILTREESELARLLATLQEGDWARLLHGFKQETKDDIRAGLGTIMAEWDVDGGDG